MFDDDDLLKNWCLTILQVEKAAGGAGGPGLVEVLEAKGLDMVRRDWCPLSKDTGNYALQQILSGGCHEG
jgi:DNA polymerase alpha subunit A